ncbi:MAG: isocitrate lyase/PEP mutase family protein [Pirellulales bacterium]|nr:isocitrate lyase/PEP mutase family protein [Pirellulales bacterium]
MSTPARRLRELLAAPPIIRSLGVYDAFSARIVEAAGCEMLFLGGFGVAASRLGLPDLGLLTLTEMTDAVRAVSRAVRVPVVADGDTGHGDLLNVERTVREFESAGAAGMLLEDQQFPKRCGHFEGKQLIPTEEMVLKLRAALDARTDPDFVLIARTDARAIEGFEGAVERARQYAAAGADLCFVEAPTSREEIERLPRSVGHPLLVNMLTGGRTPIFSAEELEQLGYRITVCPVAPLLASGAVLRRLATELLSAGRVDHLADKMMTFDEVKQLLGVPELLGLRERLERRR